MRAGTLPLMARRSRRILDLARRYGPPGALLAGFAGCLGAVAQPPPEPASKDSRSLFAPNFDGDSFFNPWPPFELRTRDLLRFVLTRRPARSSTPLEVRVVPNDGSELSGVQQSSQITWVGHATFAIIIEGHWRRGEPLLARRNGLLRLCDTVAQLVELTTKFGPLFLTLGAG